MIGGLWKVRTTFTATAGRPSGRKVVVMVQEYNERWHVMAVSGAGTSADEILASQSHAIVGEFVESGAAFEAGETYLQKWMAEGISEGSDEKA